MEELAIAETLLLQELVCRDWRFELSRPLRCFVASEKGRTVLTGSSPAIVAWGDTFNQALKGFGDEFSFLWFEYAAAPDADLTADARRLKEAMLKSVKQAHRCRHP